VVLGLWQGKYTVLTDPDTGEKRLTRFRMESLGYAHSDTVATKLQSLIVQTRETDPDKADELQGKLQNILDEEEQPLKSLPNMTKNNGVQPVPPSVPSPPQGSVKKSEDAASQMKALLPRFDKLPRMEEFKVKVNKALQDK
jgi:hypothetical protein